MKMTIYLILCCSLILVPQCTRDLATNADIETPAVGYRINISPTLGTTTTSFHISVSYTSEVTTHEPLQHYRILYTQASTTISSEWTPIGKPIYLTFPTIGKKKIAFKLKGKSDTIYTKQDSLYVGELRPLTDNNSIYLQGNPEWCRANNDLLTFDWRDTNGEHKIFTASISARTVQQHTFDPGDGRIECHQFPLWSPDGDRIVFVNNSTGEINLITLANNSVRSLGIPGTWPLCWNPGGDILLVRRTTERVGLWQFRFADSSYVELLPECSAATFSPAGDQLAVSHEDEYSQSLRVLDAVSMQIKTTFVLSHQSAKIAWSPRSDWICTCDENDVIHFLNVNSARRLSFYTPELAYVWWPTWSPDGLSIAIEATHIDDSRSRIWAFDCPDELF